MSKFRKKKKGLPPVNTAALPDIVFMLLFFFMVTTTMRETDLKVEPPQLPTASEVKKLEDKSLVSTIYVGKATDAKYGNSFNRIQLNDKIGTAEDVPAFILSRRDKISEDKHLRMTTSIKADKRANVGTITDIREQLREVNALKISYSAAKGDQ